MKFNTVALTLATAGTLAAAQGHRHAHQHLHKQRDVVIVHATTWEFELDGQTVPAAEVCKGVADGTLAWADGVAPTGACDGAHALGQTAAEFVETSSSVESSTSSSSVAPTTSSTSTTSTTSTSSTTTAAPAATSSSNTGATGIDAPFPDGELDCSVFPSQYGAVPLDYLGLGGWSGVQFVNIVGDLVNDIVTAVAGQTCAEGAMCSYACPAGYQKSQWPSTQGATGQSVGGIQCQGGKLHLTNPGLSKTLCIPGVGGVQVQNTLGDQVAVCRTDYPGTESETIPTGVAPGAVLPLTCPDGANYYQWQGKTTSAQYYVNNKGISIEEGCQWGDGSKPVGNWAPLNLGVGENNGKWLSIFQNAPTTNAPLDFNIRIEGDNLSGSCKYENGQFISETGSNTSGCTVEVLSGEATYVFY